MNTAVLVNGRSIDTNAMDNADTYVPEHLRDGLLRWIEHNAAPGNFLCAVLRNDLREAVARADTASQADLAGVVRWLYNYAPAACWGSPEKFCEWMAAS